MGSQKLRKYGRKTPIWESYASICTSIAPSLLISLGQSSLGRAQFLFGGAQAVVWGSTATECPPWRRACQSQQKISQYHDLAQDFLNLRINQFYKK